MTPATPAPTPATVTAPHNSTPHDTKHSANKVVEDESASSTTVERDEFGLPITKPRVIRSEDETVNPVDEKDGKNPSDRDSFSHARTSQNLSSDNRLSKVPDVKSDPSSPKPQVSEYSHLALVTKKEEKPKDNLLDLDDEWQEMPAYASRDIYDEYGRLIAKEEKAAEAEVDEQLGGASKGYSRVNDDDDDASVTSMDENTGYLFNDKDGMGDEASKTPLSQMQATKDLLTEGQRIAYVGVCRLAMIEMVNTQQKIDGGKGRKIKKALTTAAEHTKMWSQKMIHRLYTHMDISTEGKSSLKVHRMRDANYVL